MKQIKKIVLIIVLLLLVPFLIRTETLANSLTDNLSRKEYTEEYKEYLQLTEEEQERVLPPRMFEIEQEKTTRIMRNPLRLARSVGNGLIPKFSLQDVIGENVVVKNQGVTNACWTFASLSSLETNLALTGTDKTKVYDFSERHMDYATSQSFLDGASNEKGFNRKVKDGGNWGFVVSYLTNGTGAIKESDMPFENNQNDIEISKIQDKEIISQVYDTKSFPSYETTQITETVKQQMKDHIKNYGSIYAHMHGANILSEYYNTETGAVYCDNKENCPMDHAISIIGWDDDYAIENFNPNHRPKNKGAWIIKNSWGDTVGKQGFMYVSYEDINIYAYMNGIIKASSSIDYENIYQYDDFGSSQCLNASTSKIYLGNLFEKKNSGKEYLTQVAFDTPEKCTCKVYVNTTNASKAKSDLTSVKLKEGDSKTIEAGYHTLEFAEPVEITGDDFVVVIEIQGTEENRVSFYTEAKVSESVDEDLKKITTYDNVKVESGKCFYTDAQSFESNVWQDLSKIGSVSNRILNSDTTIKAFTVSKVNQVQDNVDEENKQDVSTTENKQDISNEEDKAKEDERIENSNFDGAKSSVKNVRFYSSADTSKEEYATMDIEIDGIIRSSKQDSYEYYYHLAPSQVEQNIEDWIKITEKQNDSNKLTFTVNVKDMENSIQKYQELSNVDTLYLYIKEVAKKGEEESVKISNPIILEPDSKTEIYINNAKINLSNSSIENDNLSDSLSSSTKDETMAKKILPNTGVGTMLIIMVIIVIVGVGAYKYIRYKILSQYIK